MRQDPIQTASAALTQILHRSLGITVKEGNKSYRSLKKPNPVYLPDDYEDSSDSDSETINVRSCQRDIAAFEERLESSSKNDICQSPGKQTSDYERFSVDWSSNVSELDDLPRREHTVQGVYHRLTNIRLVKMNIQELDKTFAINLAHLKTIDLSQNKLNTLHHVPSSVDNLMVYENNLTSISQKVLQSPQLAHLAVGYNAIKTLPTFKTSTLVSLDVSYNALETLSQVVEGIKGVHTLKHLFLQGNPLALHPHYRCYVLQSVPQVVLLDDIPIDEDEWNTVSIVEVPFDVDWLALQVFVQPLGLPELPIPNEAAEGVEMSYVATYEWPGVFELQRFSLTTEEKTLVFSPTTALHQLPTAAVRDAMLCTYLNEYCNDVD